MKMSDNDFRHDPATIEKAKKLYLEYESIATVAKSTGLKHSTISYHVNKKNGWREERNLLKADLLGKVAESRRGAFAQMTLDSVTIIQKCLAAMANSENPPTPHEAKKVTEILEALDRITRLDDGAPTEIVAEKPFAIEHITTIVQSDPFHLEAPYDKDHEPDQ